MGFNSAFKGLNGVLFPLVGKLCICLAILLSVSCVFV